MPSSCNWYTCLVPRRSLETRPALVSSLRWRYTAGRLIGSSPAISCTDFSPRPSSRRISRRFASPSASNGPLVSCIAAIGLAARLHATLEPGRELPEGRIQVGNRLADRSRQGTAVLLAHGEQCATGIV